jgi:hypothetical protein
MVRFLRDSGTFSERKAQLFVAASCRRVWSLLKDQRSRTAVEVSERFADGELSNAAMEDAFADADAAFDYVYDQELGGYEAAAAVVEATTLDYPDRVFGVMQCIEKEFLGRRLKEDPEQVQAGLLRDIFGNPFRPASLAPAVLAWNDAIVVRLAQAAYEERHLPKGTLDNTRLLILADALEEAGCTDADILGHLRGRGSHVRGCWVVDLCLGKS